MKESLARFSRLVSDAEEQAKDHCEINDLTATQMNYLETIQELGNPNITELSVALGVKKPSVTVVVDRLIVKGCLYKTHSDEDRRSSHLHLTEVGERINHRHDYAHQYLSEVVAKKLSEQQQQLFISLLDKITEKTK